MSPRTPPTPTRLGEMLRLYRTVRQQALRELAPEMGVSPATLLRLEAGHKFDADTLLILWRWLLESPLP